MASPVYLHAVNMSASMPSHHRAVSSNCPPWSSSAQRSTGGVSAGEATPPAVETKPAQLEHPEMCCRAAQAAMQGSPPQRRGHSSYHALRGGGAMSTRGPSLRRRGNGLMP